MTEVEVLDGVPVTHRRIQLPEVTLHVAEAGSGDRLVVLLHGFPDWWFTWRAQIPALVKAGFRVVAPDMRGYNTSDKPKHVADYDVTKLARDVAELISALGAERADVVGHDWGGVVAWVFAMLHGDRLGKLAILNTPHPITYQRALRRDFGQVRRSWYVFFFQLPWLPEVSIRMQDFRGLRDLFRGLRARGRMSDEDYARYVGAMSHPGALTAMVNYYRAAFRRPPGKRPGSQPIASEVLVIWGMKDRYLKPELADPPPRWVPKVRVERIAEGSHFVQMDQPEQVNSALLHFLRAT